MEDKKQREDADPRLDYLASYVTKTFRMKYDKWQKMLMTEDKVTTPFPLETRKISFPRFTDRIRFSTGSTTPNESDYASA